MCVCVWPEDVFGVAVRCVDDGLVVTSGSYLAVQRALQVSTACDKQSQSQRRREDGDGWSVTPLGRLKLRGCVGDTHVAAAGKSWFERWGMSSLWCALCCSYSVLLTSEWMIRGWGMEEEMPTPHYLTPSSSPDPSPDFHAHWLTRFRYNVSTMVVKLEV